MVGYAREVTAPKKRGRTARRIDKRVRGYSDIVAALPESIGSKLKFNREVFAKSYALSRWLMVYGLFVLDAHEYVLLHFIASRTLHFGKLAEMITKDHFLRGVWSNDEPVCAPVKMGPSVLYRTIRSLESKGIISVLPVQLNGRDLPTIYEVEIDFISTLRPSEELMSKLRAPRQKPQTADIFDFEAFRQAKLSGLGGSTRNHLPDDKVVLPRTTNIINKNNADNEVVATAAPRNENASLRVRRKPRAAVSDAIDCNVGVREVIEVTLARSTAKREQKVSRAARGAAITLSDLNATWKKAMIAAYGSCTVAGLTNKEYGMFKRIAKAHEVSCTWLEFFTWAIDHWQGINREAKQYGEFKRKKEGDWSMKQEDLVFLGSDTPDLLMAVKNLPKLLKRYAAYALTGRSVEAKEESAEVQALRKELAESQREARTNAALVRKALSAKSMPTVATPKPAKRVNIVNPESDTFFEDTDSELPGWK